MRRRVIADALLDDAGRQAGLGEDGMADRGRAAARGRGLAWKGDDIRGLDHGDLFAVQVFSENCALASQCVIDQLSPTAKGAFDHDSLLYEWCDAGVIQRGPDLGLYAA
jgi:hypothetical protein